MNEGVKRFSAGTALDGIVDYHKKLVKLNLLRGWKLAVSRLAVNVQIVESRATAKGKSPQKLKRRRKK